MENEKRARNEILLLVHFLAGSAVLEEKKTKKNEENRGRERARERDGGQLPRNRHQFDFVMLRIFAKQERNGCSVSNKMKTNNNNNNRNYNHKLKRYKQ